MCVCVCARAHVLGGSRLSSDGVKEQICQRAPDSRITSIYEAALYVSPQHAVPNVQYEMYSAKYTVPNVQYEMYSAKCTVPNVQYEMYSAKCTVRNVQCQMYSAKCTIQHFTVSPSVGLLPFVSSAAIVRIAARRLFRGTAVTSYRTKGTKFVGVFIRFDGVLAAVS